MNQDLWYVAIDGNQLEGQYTTAQVRQIAQQNSGKAIYVWKPGMAQWSQVSEMQEMNPVAGPQYPGTVRAAGTIWAILGGLILLSAVLALLLTSGDRGSVWVGLVFGIAFVYLGIQHMRGTVRDTLNNGIGSIILGLLDLGYSGLLVGGVVSGGTPQAIGGVISGMGLLVAGVLALVGRRDYKAWYQAHKDRTASSGV